MTTSSTTSSTEYYKHYRSSAVLGADKSVFYLYSASETRVKSSSGNEGVNRQELVSKRCFSFLMEPGNPCIDRKKLQVVHGVFHYMYFFLPKVRFLA